MIVASTPGSGVDIVARMMATRMTETLKSSIVVDKRAGAGHAIVDLLGGQVRVMFANVVAVLGHMRSGKVRALATTAQSRSAATPDLPTVVESGVPGYVVTSWFGLLAPARTAQPHVVKLNAALNAALADRDTIDRLAAEGAEPAPGTPDAFGKHVASELAIWGKVIRASGL